MRLWGVPRIDISMLNAISSQIIRATKYPITGRGGKGYGVLQRGSLDSIIHDEARPVPPPEQVLE